MTEVNREYLIIPTPEELQLAVDSMHSNIKRAARRGVSPDDFPVIRHENANRILDQAPHLAERIEKVSTQVIQIVNSGNMSPADTYVFSAKDLLELLATATTYTQLPDIDIDRA